MRQSARRGRHHAEREQPLQKRYAPTENGGWGVRGRKSAAQDARGGTDRGKTDRWRTCRPNATVATVTTLATRSDSCQGDTSVDDSDSSRQPTAGSGGGGGGGGGTGTRDRRRKSSRHIKKV